MVARMTAASMVLPVSAAAARCGTGAAAPSTTEALRQAPSARSSATATSAIGPPKEALSPCLRRIERVVCGSREADGGDDFAREQIVLPLPVDLGQPEEGLEAHLAPGIRGAGDLECGTECDQRRRTGGRMPAGTSAVIEDRVVLVLAVEGEAGVAPLRAQ